MNTKETLLAVLVSVILPVCAGRALAEERGGRDDGRDRGRGRYAESSGRADRGNRAEAGAGRSIIRMQTIQLSRPERREPAHIVNDNRHIEAPRHYENGAEIHERPAQAPPLHHAEVVHNEIMLRSIAREQGAERARNQYYWHNSDGRRYSHYRDADDIDWYGFYFGPSFYWTRYYGDRWWWYDQGYARWVFWWNGYWWWQGPGGSDYVYMDNNYYPYQEGSVTVLKSTTVPVAEASSIPGEGKQWTSPDLRRMVEVTGTQDAALLYDRTGANPVFMSYLGRDVAKVRFSGGVTGQPLQILLDFKDGTFALFDADGKAEEPQSAVQVPPLPASPPVSGPGSTAPDAPN